jgi:WD repeat-containing protein 70
LKFVIHIWFCCQVWDARRLKAPVAAFGDLPAAPSSQCCFSPDESLVVTGTANVPGAPSSGALVTT